MLFPGQRFRGWSPAPVRSAPGWPTSHRGRRPTVEAVAGSSQLDRAFGEAVPHGASPTESGHRFGKQVMASFPAGGAADDLPWAGDGQSADFADRRRQLDRLVLHFDGERVVIAPLLP